jgi:hypothetical protein
MPSKSYERGWRPFFGNTGTHAVVEDLAILRIVLRYQSGTKCQVAQVSVKLESSSDNQECVEHK